MKKARKAVEEAGFTIKTLAEIGDLEYVTTGFEAVDKLVKLPRARITEIYGMQGIGKTDLMLQCLSKMSQEGKVLYIDAENALNPERLRSKGGKAENISISDAYILEEVASFVIKQIGKYDIIVIDSVAALVPRSEAEGETGDHFVGLKARLMGQWLRQMTPKLGKSKTALVFINQLRATMSIYGDPLFTPGGKALPYAASLRLRLSTVKADRIIKDGTTTGHWVHVEVTKSRVSPPHQQTKFKLEY